MEKEQINALAKYLGCEIDYDNPYYNLTVLDAEGLGIVQRTKKGKLTLHLKPLSSLTQEDYERMYLEAYSITGTTVAWWFDVYQDYFDGIIGSLPHKQADWLRNNSYYLGEESIKEFVKLK